MKRYSRRKFIQTVGSAGIASTLLSCAGASESVGTRERFDVLIRGGSVLDGTGASELLADVGIRDGKIVAVGNLAGAGADRVIGATGLKVAPGFIDIHSHTDMELFLDPRAESKIRQGVTTEVNGMDGDSPAPLGGHGLERSLKGFENRFGFPCPYRDMDGFFGALEKNGSAQNIVSFVGLGTVRDVVVGPDDRPPTEEEMQTMKREVGLAIEQGCWGASTGLEYTPGSFATTEELWKLMEVIPANRRLYATHMRNEDDRVLEAIQEALTIARNSGASLQVSHLKAQNKVNWPKGKRALEMLEEGLAEGLDVHADRYPYIAFNTGLTNLFPLWSRDGGREKFLARLQDADTVARIRPEVEKKVRGLSSWNAVLISSVREEENKRYQGRRVDQIAKAEQADPFEFVVELLIQERGRVGMVGFGMDEPGTEMVLAWKNTMVASDGGSHSPSRADSSPHPRAYGTFPRAIAHYQRERKITTLPDMIRKMTSLPAQKLGLPGRGRLATGFAADLVLFDYETIEDRATFLEPHQFPVGIPYVLVNGTIVVDNGVQTDLLPGMVLRSS
ncbi:MAG: D-aminoacylase [Bacteroidota bacterium]